MKIPLFDVDGTLFKTGGKLHSDAFTHAFKTVFGISATKDDAGIPEGRVDNQIIMEVMSFHGVKQSVIKKKVKLATALMGEYFIGHKNQASPQILPGVKDLLSKLRKKGFSIGVLTGNVETIAWTKIEVAGLRDYFDFGAFGDKVLKRVDLVDYAQRNAEKILGRKINKRDLIIIGDTPRDIKCARDAGIKVIAVSTGIYSFEELEKEKPDLLVHSLEEQKEVTNFLKS